MATLDTETVRRALLALCPDQTTLVCYQQLFEALGLDDEPAKARLRSRVKDMLRKGELQRVDDRNGCFFLIREAMPKRTGESFSRMWRTIRASTSGWDYREIAQITRVNYTTVRRYCQWLTDEGFIRRHGKKGNTQFWRTTQKAAETRYAPLPPVRPKDPFEAERSAACRLVRLMMETDPSRPQIKAKIQKELNVLAGRFGKPAK